jgi:hypothetical protein
MHSRILVYSFLLFLFGPSPLLAFSPVNTEDDPQGVACMEDFLPEAGLTKEEIRSLEKEEQKLLRTERRIDKFQKFMVSKRGQKLLDGMNDPVDRWFWYWVLGWGTGIMLTILAGGAFTTGAIGILWFGLFVGGSISLVVWLVKRFS